MRIVIITQGISRIVKPLLESKYEICGVIESAGRNDRTGGLNVLFDGVRFLLGRKSLKSLCRQRSLPYILLNKLNQAEVAEWVRLRKPDLIVVHSMSQLLRESIFSFPRFGTINLHPSFLPEYRGPFPDFWQYYNYEKMAGVTVHYINAGEDRGAILAQQRIPIEAGMRSPDWLDKVVGDIGIHLLFQVIEQIASGTVKSFEQPEHSPTIRARNIRVDEHHAIIPWDEWSVSRVWHLLRGTELWLNAIPQPSGLFWGQRWVIGEFEYAATDGLKKGHLALRQGHVVVVCRDGFIYLSVRWSLGDLITSFVRSSGSSRRNN